jgi:hypothetical protein
MVLISISSISTFLTLEHFVEKVYELSFNMYNWYYNIGQKKIKNY